MCGLNTEKTHNTRNVQWMGKMHKGCVKEDAVSVDDSSNSDGTKDKRKENDEKKMEVELPDEMAEATETVDSEQSIEEGKVRRVKTHQKKLRKWKKWELEQEGKNNRWEMSQEVEKGSEAN